MVGSPHRRFRRYFSFHQTHLPLPYPFMCPPPHTFLPYHHRHHHLHHRRRQHHLFHRPYPIRPTHMPRMGSQLRAKLPPPSHRRSRRHHQDMEGRTTRRKGQGRLRHRRRNGERVEGAVYRRIWQGRRKSRHGRCTSFHAFPRRLPLTCVGLVECSRYNVIYHRRRRDRQNIQTCVPLTTPLDSPPKNEKRKKTNSVVATYARSWSLLGSLAAEEPPLEDGLNGH